MDFTLDETQRDVAGLAADVLAKTVDLERPVDESGYDQRVWRALAEAGLLAMAMPADVGGDGLGITELAVLLMEVGRSAAGVPALPLACAALPLARLGTERQRAALLPSVASGEKVVTAAVHEPVADPAGEPATWAVSGQGNWTLTGVKTRVPSVSAADAVLVTAATGDGTVVFVVDPRARGATVAGTTLRLDGVEVAATDRLPEHTPGKAAATLRRYTLAGAVALGSGALAGALALTTEHVGKREQFGRPLATFQAVAQQIADVYIAERTVYLSALSAVWRLGTGRDPQPDLGIAARWFAAQAPQALATCHHLHGGLGVDVTYPLHHYYALIKELSACTSS